jgi:hypothetical protein
MVAPNKQRFVNGKTVVVALAGENRAMVDVLPRPKVGAPDFVSIKPLIDGGLDEIQALEYILEIAATAVAAATSSQTA